MPTVLEKLADTTVPVVGEFVNVRASFNCQHSNVVDALPDDRFAVEKIREWSVNNNVGIV